MFASSSEDEEEDEELPEVDKDRGRKGSRRTKGATRAVEAVVDDEEAEEEAEGGKASDSRTVGGDGGPGGGGVTWLNRGPCLVVSGVVDRGEVRDHSHMLLGPDGLGQWRDVEVHSVQSLRVRVPTASAGQSATFALLSLPDRRPLLRSVFRRGMVLVAPTLSPATWTARRFTAEVLLLHHPTTLRAGAVVMVHVRTLRQAAYVDRVEVWADPEAAPSNSHAPTGSSGNQGPGNGPRGATASETASAAGAAGAASAAGAAGVGRVGGAPSTGVATSGSDSSPSVGSFGTSPLPVISPTAVGHAGASPTPPRRHEMRPGDRGTVLLRFLHHPEFLTPGAPLLLRDGPIRAIGKVTHLVVDAAPARGSKSRGPAGARGAQGFTDDAPSSMGGRRGDVVGGSSTRGSGGGRGRAMTARVIEEHQLRAVESESEASVSSQLRRQTEDGGEASSAAEGAAEDGEKDGQGARGEVEGEGLEAGAEGRAVEGRPHGAREGVLRTLGVPSRVLFHPALRGPKDA